MFIYFYLIFHNYVNRLKVEKLKAMAKLHTHYITNAQKELKYAYACMSEDDFQAFIRTALNGSDDFDENERDDISNDNDDNDDNSDRESKMSNHNSNNQKTTKIE